MFRTFQEIGVDVGSTTVLICVKGKGIVLREPSVVALAKDTGEVRAVGDEAYRMLGRTPRDIVTVRPMRDGVIADHALTEKMLQSFIRKVATGPSRFLGQKLMVSVPSGASEAEKRAVFQAVRDVGVKKTTLIEAPLAAALGAGLEVTGARGSLIVDIGGGTTDIAIISLGGVVVAESLRIAGSELDEAIVRFVRHKAGLLIGDRTAEEVKLRIGAARANHPSEVGQLEVRGRDVKSGLAKTATVSTEDVAEALQGPLQKIADGVQRVLETAPPELVADAIDRGISLTGGGALLKNLDDFLRQSSGLPVTVAENPQDCVALGAGKALELTEELSDALISDVPLQR